MSEDNDMSKFRQGLSALSRRMASYREKIKRHHQLGQHIGHLVKMEETHSDLNSRMNEEDVETWSKIGAEIHKDVYDLAHTFEKWTACIEEEFRQTNPSPSND